MRTFVDTALQMLANDVDAFERTNRDTAALFKQIDRIERRFRRIGLVEHTVKRWQAIDRENTRQAVARIRARSAHPDFAVR